MDTTSVSSAYYVLRAFLFYSYMFVSFISFAVLFVFRFVQAISATESWRYVTDLGIISGQYRMIRKSYFAARRRPLYPTVALDSPPSLVVYSGVLYPCPNRALLWFRGEEESIAINRTVVYDPLPFTTTASRRKRYPFWARGASFFLTPPIPPHRQRVPV
jgi:hypothetical protein